MRGRNRPGQPTANETHAGTLQIHRIHQILKTRRDVVRRRACLSIRLPRRVKILTLALMLAAAPSKRSRVEQVLNRSLKRKRRIVDAHLLLRFWLLLEHE